MDHFLPLAAVDAQFDSTAFFALPHKQALQAFQTYFAALAQCQAPDIFTSLFDTLSQAPPATVAALSAQLHFSTRQCQRLFAHHFGLTPQMVLSILRFQRGLSLLTGESPSAATVLQHTTYYDQAHFIKDFKRNIGLTPRELVGRYTG